MVFSLLFIGHYFLKQSCVWPMFQIYLLDLQRHQPEKHHENVNDDDVGGVDNDDDVVDNV